MTEWEHSPAKQTPFFGRKVMWAAFFMAIFGWGAGVYGPPVFLHAVVERTGWPVGFVSAAVTVHYVFGALIITQLPRLYEKFGFPRAVCVGSVALAFGILGWAAAEKPWHLIVAALLTGGGWVNMGAAAVNAAVSPWFIRNRPSALSLAYNGASIGGVIFSPLWAVLIFKLSFPVTALLIGGVSVAVMCGMAFTVFSHTPKSLGQFPDGDTGTAAPTPARATPPSPNNSFWRSRAFLTLAGGMALGLFAQIGLLAHLYSVLVPELGAQLSGYALGLATCCAIAGRSIVVRLLPPGANRRFASCICYAIQAAGSFLLLLAFPNPFALALGVACFGLGIGNATSLPPLIAQQEFTEHECTRAVPLCIAISQGTYAFAPALFGLLRTAAVTSPSGNPWGLFCAVGLVQLLAIVCFLAGAWGKAHRQP